MKSIFSTILIFCLIFLATTHCLAQQSTEEGPYTFKRGSRDGIGKWYMGREIAHVMGYQGINWLNRPEREREENTGKLIKNMEIRAVDDIADIGAGSGYHVLKIAPIASEGTIYAVDIQDEMLAEIRINSERRNLTNIEIIKGSESSVNLPENSIDKVLMVDVYHEFNFPVEMIASINKAMRPDARLYLIEYRGEDNSVPIKPLHKMTKKQAVKEMQAAGLELVKNISNLPWQHCMVFRKAD